jgi:hypothetical protein
MAWRDLAKTSPQIFRARPQTRAKEFRFRSLSGRRFTAWRFNFTEKIFRAGADGARYRQNFSRFMRR